MLIKDIDLNKLENLVKALPDGIECTMITFENNDINLHLIAGSKQLESIEYYTSLNKLSDMLADLDKLKRGCQHPKIQGDSVDSL